MLFLADGDHIGVAPIPQPVSYADIDSSRVGPRAGCSNCVSLVAGLPPLGATDTSRATQYSPWQSLLPRYWLPVFASTTTDGTSFGATTSGYDVIGRHSYTIEALHNSRWAENSAWLWYRYAGFGLPLIDFYASQNYSNANGPFLSPADTTPFGFTERERIASLQATFIRPRFRSYGLFSIGESCKV